MTEAEWLACNDPLTMLEFLQGKASERKLRLFAVGCCRRISHLFSDKGNAAILAAEKFADGKISQKELHAAWKAVGFPKNPARHYAASAARAASCSPGYDGTAHAAASAANASGCGGTGITDAAVASERAAQADLLRDVMRNPFRQTVMSDERATNVVGIARAIYEDRAFDCLPILADALEEAGCSDAEILSHCRGPGPHVRGCWAVDLLLGKE